MNQYTSYLFVLLAALATAASCSREGGVGPEPIPVEEPALDYGPDHPRELAFARQVQSRIALSTVRRIGDRLYITTGSHPGRPPYRLIALDTTTLAPLDSFNFSEEIAYLPNDAYIARHGGELLVSSDHFAYWFNEDNLSAGPVRRIEGRNVGIRDNWLLPHGDLMIYDAGLGANAVGIEVYDPVDGSTRLICRYEDRRETRFTGGRKFAGFAIAENDDGSTTLYANYSRFSHTLNRSAIDVMAYDYDSGQLLWHVPADSLQKPDGSFASIRPALVVDSILLVRMAGEYVALDRFDGSEIWRVDLRDLVDGERLGIGPSEYEYRDGIVVVNPDGGEPSVFGLDIRNGREVWRQERDAIEIHPKKRFYYGERDVINVTFTGYIQRYDVTTGEVKWKMESPLDSASLHGDANFRSALHLDPWGSMYSTDGYEVLKWHVPE